MFATLDIQLNTVDFSDDLSNAAAADTGSRGRGGVDFANVLRGRADTTFENVGLDGQFLPPNGNSLPPLLEPVQVSLPVNPVPSVPNTAATELSAHSASAADRDDDGSLLGSRREALLEGQRLLVDRGNALVIGSGPGGHQGLPSLDTSANDKGLPRVFVPPTAAAEVAPKKSGPRDFVPPTRGHRVDIPTTLSAQIPVLDGLQPTPARADLPMLHRVPKTHGPSKRGDALPKFVEPTKFAPIASGAVTSAGIEAAAVGDSARLSVTKAQHLHGGGHGQAAAHATPAAPAMTAPASPAFAAELDLATQLINTPVRDAQWADRLSERLVMLAGGPQRTAEIRLTPAELGPLRVQISIEEGATNVAFQAHHAVTREALEQALPRLRELLEENGMRLGNASVSEQDVNGRRGETNGEEQRTSAPGGSPESPGDDGEPSATRLNRVVDGMVDTFA